VCLEEGALTGMNALSAIRKNVDTCKGMMESVSGVHGEASPRLRIGAVFSSIPGWGAGVGFFRMFIRSLALVADECGIEVGAVFDRQDDRALPSLAGLPGGRWSMLTSKEGAPALRETASFHRIGCFVDLFNSQPWVKGVGTVAWLPDFQHLHLRDHFTADELAVREKTFEERAVGAELILCSSETVAADFRSVFPLLESKARVARFPSNLVFETMPDEQPASVLTKYHLPDKYALVANQYWSHKNHQAVLNAVAAARKEGVIIPVVLTGLPLDSRDASNGPTSQILQSIAKLGLSGQVIPLGQVPYRDLIQLMRAAALIIQPSRFEGWSTIVQDAKALGRPLMCSDIPVHREQAPSSLGFFECDDPDSLARLLVEHWPSLNADWDREREATHLQNHLEVARDYGKTLAAVARSALSLARATATPD
jgi:glycosyltransferase involved in cell wall biosynthesis